MNLNLKFVAELDFIYLSPLFFNILLAKNDMLLMLWNALEAL